MIHRWWQLAIRSWQARFRRTLLYSIAVVTACALVVFLTSSFATGERTLWSWHHQWIGAVDIQVSARPGRAFTDSTVQKIRSVPGVAVVSTRLQDRAQLICPQGSPSVQVVGKQLPQDPQLHPQVLLAGRQLADPNANEILVEQSMAEKLKIRLGDTVQLRVHDQGRDFTVVGIIDRPSLLAFIAEMVHVPLGVAQAMMDRPGQVDAAFIKAGEGVDVGDLSSRIGQVLGAEFHVRASADRDDAMRDNLSLWRTGLVILCGLVLVLAMFLIFATVTCGLVQRVSEMGTLRCLGASRGQLARLVVFESLPIAIWGILIGLPVGLLGSWLLAARYSHVLAGGWVISYSGLALAAGGALVATMAGAILPAIGAARTSPMQACRPRGRMVRRWTLALATIIGLGVILLPLLWVYRVNDVTVALYGYVFVGMPLLVCGFFLLTPLLLTTLGRGIGWVAGKAIRVSPRLINGQVQLARWRSAAIAIAVALCVALVVTANTRTESLLAGWKLPTGFPDLLVFVPEGMDQNEADATMARLGVQRWTGVNAFDIDIVGVKDDKLPNVLESLMSWRHGNAWFMAVEPSRMEQVIRLDYVQGNAEDAVRKLSDGRYVIVPASFARAKGKWMGDTLTIRTNNEGLQDFEIAAVVTSLAVETAEKHFDLGEVYLQNVAYTIFGSSESAGRYFDSWGYSTLLIDVSSPAAGDEVFRGMEQTWPAKQMFHLSLRRLKEQIDREFRRLALIFSLVAGLLSAAVASIGVANAMQASVYSRGRELGVLRAVGMTRGQLLRLILAEGLVLGLVGGTVGVLFGLYGSLIGSRIYELMLGGKLSFAVPVREVGYAVLLATGLTLLASIAAGIRAGRANVLDAMRE